MSTASIPIYFDSIALGLPGGGYRAAGFSLGILSFLNECEMLDRVKAISTVSGGTITGVSYAKSVADNKDFKIYFNEVKGWLQKDSLMSDSLNSLRNKEEFGQKRQNLINAFALQYRAFVPGTFGGLSEKLKNSNSLCEVIFNATDFENGYAFRFKNTGRFGNGKVTYSEELINQVKLGDIIAASSCFPGGFEPMTFPGDFIQGDYDAPEISLMDGGIIDNQGSSSYMTGGNLKYSCYFIADAGGYKIKGFRPAVENRKTRRISSLFNIWILFILTILTVASFFLTTKFPLFLLSIATTFFATLQIGLFVIQKYAQKIAGINVPFKLPRSKIGLYLVDRISSILLLNTSIFLKGAKSRNITSLFDEGGEKVSKLSIYGLTLNDKGKPVNIILWDKIKLVIGDDYPPFLSDRSKAATNFGTTLWFTSGDEKNQVLDDLIFTGEAVCCLSIISHTIRNLKKEISIDVKKEFADKYNKSSIKLGDTSGAKEILYQIDKKLNTSIREDPFLKSMGEKWIKLISIVD